MSEKRKKILLIAYACRPGETSEREVGWKWASLIQQRHDVFVLTRETHRPYIEAWKEKEQSTQTLPTFIYYDLPSFFLRMKSGERGLYLYYVVWSFFAILKARRLHQHCLFDITHFLTFGTMLWPQFAFLMRTRYIFGPVGGGERIPFSLIRAYDWKARVKIVFRMLLQLSLYLNPIFWLNIICAEKILVRTRETLDILPAFVHNKTELFLETAMQEITHVARLSAPKKDALTIVTVGRLIPTKINRLTLEVIANFKRAYGLPFRFLIVGDGPERLKLESISNALNLDEVVFVGKISGSEVIKQLKQSDIYFSTTMKEGGTWAFFEAITCLVPIVCLRVNGPDMIVGDECGIKVKPVAYIKTRQDLSDALLKLALSSQLRDHYAENALIYLQENFTWNRVIDRIDEIYSHPDV